MTGVRRGSEIRLGRCFGVEDRGNRRGRKLATWPRRKPELSWTHPIRSNLLLVALRKTWHDRTPSPMPSHRGTCIASTRKKSVEPALAKSRYTSLCLSSSCDASADFSRET